MFAWQANSGTPNLVCPMDHTMKGAAMALELAMGAPDMAHDWDPTAYRDLL